MVALRKKWLGRLALLAALVLFAAACNGEDPIDDDVEEPADTEPEPEPEEEPEDDPAEEEEPAEDEEPAEEEEEPVAEANGLVLGYVLPETGPLAFLAPPQLTSLDLAVQDINEAGGVLGEDITYLPGDEAGDAAIASQSADNLIGQGVHAIIGAAASGMSEAIIDQITGSEIVQCSGSNTSPVFTDYDDGGFYFRTAPTDELQGPALGEAIAADGNQVVTIMARADSYGEGFMDALSASLQEQGADVVGEILYDPEAASFDAEVQQAVGEDPQAIVVIGFDEGAQVVQGLIEAGVAPDQLYTADGMRSSALWEAVDPNDPSVLEGMRGTAPGAEEDYNDRLLAEEGVDDPIFGGQVYDCVTIIALAAEAAGTTDPSVYVDEMIGITRDGTECSGFEECRDLLADGEDIDYQGVSGTIAWTDVGDPSLATYEIWEFDAEGVPIQTGTVEGRLE